MPAVKRPDETLLKIKRAVLAGRVIFTDKAVDERLADDLTELEVVESIVYATEIFKTLKSSSPKSRRREYLHIIKSPCLAGVVIYTKGKIVAESGVDTYYVLISSKLAI